MFGRRKPAPVVGTNTPEVRHFRRQLRNIEMALETVDPRADADAVRRLAADHETYRRCLREHGVHHPMPVINW